MRGEGEREAKKEGGGEQRERRGEEKGDKPLQPVLPSPTVPFGQILHSTLPFTLTLHFTLKSQPPLLLLAHAAKRRKNQEKRSRC